MRFDFRLKLFVVSLGLTVFAFLGADLWLAPSMEDQLNDSVRANAAVLLDVLALHASSSTADLDDRAAWSDLAEELGRTSRARVTIVRADGVVIGDSGVDDEVDHLEVPFRHRGEIAGVVRLALPIAARDAANWRIERLVLIESGVACAATILLWFGATHWLSRLLRKLTAAAREMAAGDLDVRTKITGSDEVAELGQALDKLAGSLSTAMRAMHGVETMRRDFLANASHELRTPVASIRSAAETLGGAATRRPESMGRFIDIVTRNAERLQHVIDEILDLSRIESKELKLSPERVPLRAFVDETLSMFRERAEQRGVELVANVSEDERVETDRGALEQILMNLIDNAVKYCPGATVRVAATHEGERTELRVEDSGPGIPESHLPRLFERFYRVDTGRSRDLGGAGLGLSIVKHLVERMHGTVEVESTVGRGSTFRVFLPRGQG